MVIAEHHLHEAPGFPRHSPNAKAVVELDAFDILVCSVLACCTESHEQESRYTKKIVSLFHLHLS
jgi:hypothetical protein